MPSPGSRLEEVTGTVLGREKSDAQVGSFFLIAGGLAAFALWFHVFEFRRRPEPL